MFGFLTRLRKDAQPRTPRPQPLTGDYAVCERPSPSETTPFHLRAISHDPASERGQLHPGGGLQLRGIVALCGHELAWDRRTVTREEIIASLPHQHATFRYCEDCLDFAGIQVSFHG